MIQAKYNPAIDVLRLVSILAVLLIHTSSRILESSHMDLAHHTNTLFINQIARFAVPLFFMISGFVLELSFKGDYLDYYKRRVSKILIPYVFWSFIYYVFIYTQHSDSFFQSLLSGSASYQLYFIPALLIFYLLFPLIHSLYAVWANKFALVGLALLQIRLLDQDYHLHGLQLYYPINIAVLNYLVFLLGMVAFRNQAKILKYLKYLWPVLLLVAAILGHYVFRQGYANYYLTYNFQLFYSQWRPSVLLYTLFLAAGLYYVLTKMRLPDQMIKSISSLSFVVFFVHIIVLETIWKYGQPSSDLGFWAAVTLGSFGLSFLIHKIPHLAKLTG